MRASLADVAVVIAALAGLALWIGFRRGALNPASRDNIVYQATGEIGTKIPDMWGGIFKSDAEKKVDEMLQTPTQKRVVTPADFVTDEELAAIRLPDYGYKPVPIGEARVINKAGTLTSGEYRDLVR